MERICENCGEPLHLGEQTCSRCGKGASLAPDQESVPCRICGTPISTYTETCPGCRQRGYPALRPRRGTTSKGPPDA